MNIHRYTAPAVNVFGCRGFSVGCGAAFFGEGKYSRDQILNNQMGDVGVPGVYDAISSLLVPTGLVAILYDRDYWSSA